MQDLLPEYIDSANIIKEFSEKLEYDLSDEKTQIAIFETNHSDENIKNIKNINHIPLPMKEAEQLISYTKQNSL